MTTDVSLTKLLGEAFQAALEDYHGPIIGKVETYDRVTARADVTPLIQRYVDDVAEDFPKLQRVPVQWPGGATYRIHWPITAGDYVELTPLGFDHSNWLASGIEGRLPPTRRRFSLSDLIAKPIPPWSMAAPPPADSHAADGFVFFGPKFYFGGASAGDFAALASKVLTELQAIRTWANSHIHTPGTFVAGPNPVTGLSGAVPPDPSPPGTAMPAPSSVASARLAIKDP
jgi:hypothetical protein